MSDIVIYNISKSYGERPVLRDFSELIPEGRVTAVMSPSGSGKTTLLRLILGLERPDKGEIRGVPRRCAAVFQEDRLFPMLSTEKNIKMALGREYDLAATHIMLTRLGLAEDADKPVSELSGGMRRRSAIARALLSDFELLALDEPFKGLDSENKCRAAEAILERSAGKTLILVTHCEEDMALLHAEKLIKLAKMP